MGWPLEPCQRLPAFFQKRKIELLSVTWQRIALAADTPDCDTLVDCEAAFEDKMMFPFPFFYADGCTKHDGLTNAQRAVFHRYTGVN